MKGERKRGIKTLMIKDRVFYFFLFAIFSPLSLRLSQHSGLSNCAHLPGPLHSENSIPSALGSHAAISPLALAQSPEAWLTKRNPVVVVHA